MKRILSSSIIKDGYLYDVDWDGNTIYAMMDGKISNVDILKRLKAILMDVEITSGLIHIDIENISMAWMTNCICRNGNLKCSRFIGVADNVMFYQNTRTVGGTFLNCSFGGIALMDDAQMVGCQMDEIYGVIPIHIDCNDNRYKVLENRINPLMI